MGVYYYIRSESHPDLFIDLDSIIDYLSESNHNPCIANIREAWININWEPVMEYLGIDFRNIYEPADPYLSIAEIVNIRNRLQHMLEDEDDEVTPQSAEGRLGYNPMRNDVGALLQYFNFYVEHNAYIVRF